MKQVMLEVKARVPALAVIAGDSTKARVHGAAREALHIINGIKGEHWERKVLQGAVLTSDLERQALTIVQLRKPLNIKAPPETRPLLYI
jgi:hypothetical protein